MIEVNPRHVPGEACVVSIVTRKRRNAGRDRRRWLRKRGNRSDRLLRRGRELMGDELGETWGGATRKDRMIRK